MTRRPPLPEVNFSDHGDVRYLHLGTPWVQGSMMVDQPYDIHLDYVQRMMAWLLFVPLERVAQVDLYDHEAAAPVLDSADFYADCRQLLSEHGAMTVNLFGRSNRYPESLDKIVSAFGAEAVWVFKPTREGNTVVLALRTPVVPKRGALAAQAEAIQARWPLPATRWVRVLKPVA